MFSSSYDVVVTDCSIADINEETITGEMTLCLMMMPRMEDPLKKNAEANNSEAPAETAESTAESAAS